MKKPLNQLHDERTTDKGAILGALSLAGTLAVCFAPITESTKQIAIPTMGGLGAVTGVGIANSNKATEGRDESDEVGKP